MTKDRTSLPCMYILTTATPGAENDVTLSTSTSSSLLDYGTEQPCVVSTTSSAADDDDDDDDDDQCLSTKSTVLDDRDSTRKSLFGDDRQSPVSTRDYAEDAQPQVETLAITSRLEPPSRPST